MKKLFTLVVLMCLLGGGKTFAAPHYYFQQSGVVLNAGATSYNFMNNNLLSTGFGSGSSTVVRTESEGWVVFNDNEEIVYPSDPFTNGTNGVWKSPWHIIDLGSNRFSSVVEGAIIRVNVQDRGNGANLWFYKHGQISSYEPLDNVKYYNSNNNSYEAVITGEAANYLKTEGLNLHAKALTIKSVEIITPAAADASSFDWTAKPCGDISITGGASGPNNGVYTLNTSNPTISFTGGGAIVITAEGKQGTSAAGYRAYYVITVPYAENQVWDFFTNPGVHPFEQNSIQNGSWGLWKSDYKSKPESGENRNVILVAKPDESARDGYSNIWNTNAFYIPETAGLLFQTKSGCFGYNNDEYLKNVDGNQLKLVTWGGYHISNNGSNDGTHPKFIIPQVKGGKYLKIWWDAQAQGGGGGSFKVTNLFDLDGKKVSNQFTITGVTVSGQCVGCIIFKVEGNSNERKDIAIELQDQGWNDLYRIEICDDYDTDMVLFQCKDTDTGWNVGGAVEYNNEFGSIVHKKGEKAERYYNGTSAKAFLNRGFTCQFAVDHSEGVSYNYEVLNVGKNVKYNYLHFTNIDGTGNIKITQWEEFGADKYILNKKETWIAVGEYTEQSYPYTWDFTDYNVKKGRLEGRLKLIPTDGENYGNWALQDASNVDYGLDTHVLVDATKGSNNFVWNNIQIEKPLFAQGSQLTYCTPSHGVGVIDETEGLRVRQCDDSETELGVGGSYDYELRFSINGGCLKYASNARQNNKLYITIPNVPQGMWVFIKASRIPKEVKVGTNTLSVDTKSGSTPDTYDTQDDVWAYQVTHTGDVDICYQGEAVVDIKAIGVTNIFKSINLLGYATESRNHAIDHKYEGIFTKNDVNAYCILTNNGYTYEYKGSPVVVKSNQEVNVVPENTGIVLFKSGHDKTKGGFNVPLFYPACNVNVLDTEAELYNYYNMMAPNVESREHTDVVETWRGEECQKFVMSRQYYVYYKHGDGTGTNSGEKTSEQEAFYRMRLSSGVAGTSNTMGANKAYLLIPSSKLPLALWNNGNGEGNPGQAKPGVIFMDDIMSLFGEEEPISGIATAIDGIESAETVNNDHTYYTISGVKIQGRPTEKGVYIMNGKKVMVK